MSTTYVDYRTTQAAINSTAMWLRVFGHAFSWVIWFDNSANRNARPVEARAIADDFGNLVEVPA